MEQSNLLIIAMAEECRRVIRQSEKSDSNLPVALHPKHLLWMCDKIQQQAGSWPDTKLNRWIGYLQGGMIAHRMLDLDGAKAMFQEAKAAHGIGGDDQDLIDHLDPGSSFEMDLGGQG